MCSLSILHIEWKFTTRRGSGIRYQDRLQVIRDDISIRFQWSREVYRIISQTQVWVGCLVHDIPLTEMFSYDTVHVNSTRMQVICGQPSANVEAFLIPAGSNDTSSATAFDPNSLDGTMDMWIRVSMNLMPPYSDSAVDFSMYWDIHNNHFLEIVDWFPFPAKAVLHPWRLKESLSFPSCHQILFTWATTDEDTILLDHTRRNGTIYNFTVGYVQVFGCSLTVNHTIVGITESLKPSDSDNPPIADMHEYTEFVWEESLSERLANTFLMAFSPIPDLGAGMEWWIKALFVSWVWGIWQGCDYPYLLTSDSEEICRNFHSSYGNTKVSEDPGDTPQLVNAGFMCTLEKGRLQIFRWQSVIAFVCSAVLCMLSFLLLGTKTDLPRGAPLRKARLVEDVYLMVDSEVPSMVKKHGIGIPLRYGVNEDESHWNLDVDSMRVKGP
ncbi:hypothetical protein F5146DRAFT_1002103 [Armillaria mellea]|nr:hypothetical protein F5146DRAFT_1002103 [Armillaria mellea]